MNSEQRTAASCFWLFSGVVSLDMAKTRSAKKAGRVANHRRVFNARRKKTMKDAVKQIGKLISVKQGKEALAMLPALYKALDKAVKSGTIKKNTAARVKSRIAKRIRAVAV